MNISEVYPVWSPESHFRFSRRDKRIVLTLLWLQKTCKWVTKDVLIEHVLPEVIGRLCVPVVRILNIPVHMDYSTFKSDLKWPYVFLQWSECIKSVWERDITHFEAFVRFERMDTLEHLFGDGDPWPHQLSYAKLIEMK